MSLCDFSKIAELVELRDMFSRRSDELDKNLNKHRQIMVQWEEDIKTYQAQVRKLREYINDGQKKLDGLAEYYRPIISKKEETIQQYKETIARLEAELRK